jgi:hypothetical protein
MPPRCWHQQQAEAAYGYGYPQQGALGPGWWAQTPRVGDVPLYTAAVVQPQSSINWPEIFVGALVGALTTVLVGRLLR